MKKIGVLTSGGDAPGMNAAIRAVVRSGLIQGLEVYGVFNGYKGLVENDIQKLTRSDVSDIVIKGGTILGSARLEDFKLEEVRKKAIDNLNALGIEGLIVIGGDGSYRGAKALTDMGINCIGLPGTIDNDIAATDYTIGFDTALNTIIENVDKLRDTSSSHHRCSVVEVMGNRCGDLALFAGITCGAEVVITKETGFDEQEILERLKMFEVKKKKRHAIVIISEKITDVDLLAQKISQHTGFAGRSTVLGHIQRGGSPTARDRILATQYGDFAVSELIRGGGGSCVCFVDEQFRAVPIDEALKTPKKSRKELFELHQRLV
ncbi:ATP-dependent 6-phosphofructokinase [Erysipelothrix larvae]|uniref:ATP-dependent 6-phosphofructokinase n=1 Tax=Erysipelothrix larvae TaxID=1514105 RepID=A0A0X8GZR1_9FIRM|nr:6-phosphofructokinase [Erysipelothrix larvae]AMC93417.1 ATP-dependent 6-phosphofructokinase [Erysipelothrix larvae]